MAKGQKKEAVESFLEKLSDTQRASIRAVGIDRAGPIRGMSLKSLKLAATGWS
jgi:hypothetical protein